MTLEQVRWEAFQKEAQWALLGRLLGGAGKLMARAGSQGGLLARMGGTAAKAGTRMVESSPLRNLLQNAPRVLQGKPFLSPRNMAAGETMIDPLGRMRTGQALPLWFKRRPLPQIAPLRPSYEGVTRATIIKPQTPVNPIGPTAYQPPTPAQVNPLGRTVGRTAVGPMPSAPGVTQSSIPQVTQAGILPPAPTVSTIPVTPPIPGTAAYSRNMFSSGGAAIRAGTLQRSMNNVLGPTGTAFARAPNPIDQTFRSLSSSPLLSKFNSLIEQVEQATFLEAIMRQNSR